MVLGSLGLATANPGALYAGTALITTGLGVDIATELNCSRWLSDDPTKSDKESLSID